MPTLSGFWLPRVMYCLRIKKHCVGYYFIVSASFRVTFRKVHIETFKFRLYNPHVTI